jgi:putative addiction module component (TIGR02574 family)
MSETVARVLPNLYALPAEDRAMIAQCLIASLEADEDDPSLLGTLNRRMDELRSGQVQAVPAEELLRRLQELYP